MSLYKADIQSFTVREVKPLGRKRYKVLLEDASVIALYQSDLNRFDIKEGASVSKEKAESVFNILKKRALERALHLLEKKDYTCSQMKKKLKEGYYPEAIVENTLEELTSRHYLDDERYADNYISYHVSSLSVRALRNKLAERGIERELILRLTDNLESREDFISEEEMIFSILKKRGYDDFEADEKVRAKTLRYLISKGYPYEKSKTCMSGFRR